MYEIKSNLGANLFFSLDEIVFQLKSNYDFTSNHKEVLKVIQDDNLLSFEDIIKKIELFRDVTITKDNIHLYYEFMSDDDLRKISILEILLDTFNKRSTKIIYTLFPGVDETIRDDIRDNYLLQDRNVSLNIVYLQTIFGVKDTLKPINEYIKEIKNSSEYKEYLLSTVKISLDIINIKKGIDYKYCTYVIYNNSVEVKRFEDVAYTQKAFINFHRKIFDEFGSYKVNKKLLEQMSDYDYAQNPYMSTK